MGNTDRPQTEHRQNTDRLHNQTKDTRQKKPDKTPDKIHHTKDTRHETQDKHNRHQTKGNRQKTNTNSTFDNFLTYDALDYIPTNDITAITSYDEHEGYHIHLHMR